MEWHKKASSKIRELFLEVPGFKYQHGATKIEEVKDDLKFIGRESTIKKIKNLLEPTGADTGAYLVTGFRGMGKTSVVNQALNELKEDARKKPLQYYIIQLSLAQDKLTDYEILKQLTQQTESLLRSEKPDLYDKWWKKVFFTCLDVLVYPLLPLAGFFLLYHFAFPSSLYVFFRELSKWVDYTWLDLIFETIQGLNSISPLIPLVAFLLLSLPLYKWLLKLLWKRLLRAVNGIHRDELHDRVSKLLLRINAKVTEDQNKVYGKWSDIIPFKKQSKEFPLATAKDIEAELIEVFSLFKKQAKEKDCHKSINKFGKWLYYKLGILPSKFVFVFDELDKIEVHSTRNLAGKELEDPFEDQLGNESSIKRQEAISKILGNFKYFLNTVDAKFVFIAGREMFDASLADVSDRDSFLSSIFHEVIYVKSFLKEKLLTDGMGVTGMTEAFVVRMLLPKLDFDKPLLEQEPEQFWAKIFTKGEDEGANTIASRRELLYRKMHLKTYAKYFKWITDSESCEISWVKDFENDPEAKNRVTEKTILILYRLIIYLSHRSNGNPKKLGKLFEDYVVKGFEPAKGFGLHRGNSASAKDAFFLRFKYNDQYKFGLIHSIIRPYLLSNGMHLKTIGR